uniref:NADH dehydrogenase [ubiquinone] iron-sulfur protein 5 n=1 Tax=Panagrolaimus sp. PS1159 TaxID=55785 RepID=A0AC35G2E0_9BILA
MASGNITPDGLSSVTPILKTKYTDSFQLGMSKQSTRCGFFEAQFYRCMEAFGTKLGRLHCDLEHRDFGECLTSEKQKKRYDAMRAEHWKQYMNGKNDKVYENHVELGQYKPDWFRYGNLGR